MSETARKSYEILVQPFEWADVEVMPKSANTFDGRSFGLAVVYFNARAVMKRLDQAFGFENWDWHVELHPAKEGLPAHAVGTLKVRVGDRVLSRTEVSETSHIEPVKGAASGALKRAFTALGNRSLYEVSLGWYECEVNQAGKFKKWTASSKEEMRASYEAQIAKLRKALEQSPEAIVSAEDEEGPGQTPRQNDEKKKPAPVVVQPEQGPKPSPEADKLREQAKANPPHPPITDAMKQAAKDFVQRIGATQYMRAIVDKIQRTYGDDVNYVWPIYVAANDPNVKDVRSFTEAMGNPYYINEPGKAQGENK